MYEFLVEKAVHRELLTVATRFDHTDLERCVLDARNVKRETREMCRVRHDGTGVVMCALQGGFRSGRRASLHGAAG